MSQILGWASELLYRSVELTDGWLGVPESISRALLFRRNWQHFTDERTLASSAKPALWIHGASVGELEDLASLFLDTKSLAKIGHTPESCVLSSSSYSSEGRLMNWKKRSQFRYAGPLPPEEAGEIDEFLALLNPGLLVISQNDLWPQLLNRLQRRAGFQGVLWLPSSKTNLPKLTQHLIDSKLLGVGFRSATDMERWQSHFSKRPLDLRVIGNPRIDRILERIFETASDPEGHILTDFGARPNPEKTSVMLGSIWKEDAEVWRNALDLLNEEKKAQLQLVALPHDSENLHEVASIRQLLPEARVLALQGVLLESYQGFNLGYVGGGFGDGLHNILEPLLWRLPVISGPRIENQGDAQRLAQADVLKVVHSSQELAKVLSLAVTDKKSLGAWKDKAAQESNHLEDSRGAIGRLMEFVRDLYEQK